MAEWRILQFLKERQARIRTIKEARDRTVAQLEKLGADIGWDVVTINLAAEKITDADLGLLSTFSHLQSLHLHHTAISDAGIANLKGGAAVARAQAANLPGLVRGQPSLGWRSPRLRHPPTRIG